MDSSLSLPPVLSSGIPLSSAHALSFLFTTSYVSSLYVSQHLFGASTPNPKKGPSPRTAHSQTELLPPISATDADGLGVEHDLGPELGSRDHPITIKRRMKAVACSTFLSVGGVYYVVKQVGRYSWEEAIRPTMALLGVPIGFALPSRVLPYLLTPGLMVGPLYAMYLSGEVPVIGWRKKGESLCSTVKREFGLVEVRNYIVVYHTSCITSRPTFFEILDLRYPNVVWDSSCPSWIRNVQEEWKKRSSRLAGHLDYSICLAPTVSAHLLQCDGRYQYPSHPITPMLRAFPIMNDVFPLYQPGIVLKRDARSDQPSKMPSTIPEGAQAEQGTCKELHAISKSVTVPSGKEQGGRICATRPKVEPRQETTEDTTIGGGESGGILNIYLTPS
ncbi:prenyl protein peptidase [Cryptococcus deuterogattii 99/473]|uniref:Prenyl protein peptidase n=1 Tax=Cryptococcus deuterogattii Ram5 TaxID=1296110 RepID=A0A0D0TCP4_9TREE|nr:prenyl protein peptidase [Cryptococcus deuterogattii MMRL2647]KIR43937.1 prenyl protein peptidase [Cryptococcus deuterogattii Ram5]KIY60221.1 prenyl protein peptidase [Cryptococcus deuterogattii 99/473]